jgi:hypothetical protein
VSWCLKSEKKKFSNKLGSYMALIQQIRVDTLARGMPSSMFEQHAEEADTAAQHL